MGPLSALYLATSAMKTLLSAGHRAVRLRWAPAALELQGRVGGLLLGFVAELQLKEVLKSSAGGLPWWFSG